MSTALWEVNAHQAFNAVHDMLHASSQTVRTPFLLVAQRGSVIIWRCGSREKPALRKAGLVYKPCRSVMLYSLARSSRDLWHREHQQPTCRCLLIQFAPALRLSFTVPGQHPRKEAGRRQIKA